jgi:hypothetical protein
MATTIKLKNSVTTTNAPSSLVQGEVAINVTDKKVWVGNAATTPVQLLGTGADGTLSTLTVGAGTVSLPSITTTGDTNTGIFFPAADTIAFTEGGTESMRVNSSGQLGVGTASPSTKLHVAGTGTQGITVERTDASTAGLFQLLSGNSTNVINASTAKPISFEINASEAMRIDTSGNVGIGTSSPNARLHLNTSASSVALTLQCSGGYGYVFNDGTYILLASDIGTTGVKFRVARAAPDNSATIDSSGNLLVGTTSASGSAQLVASASTASYALACWNNATTGNNTIVNFGTEGTFTQRGSITYNRGAGLIAYNVTSDYRAKEIISPVLNSGEVIDSVPVYMGKMKGATQARPMFIAHETPDYAHTGEKDAIDQDGNPVYQQMDASSLVPVLWAEIQSLRKRVLALESK